MISINLLIYARPGLKIKTGRAHQENGRKRNFEESAGVKGPSLQRARLFNLLS